MFGAVTTLENNELSFATGKTRQEIDLEKREKVARDFVETKQDPSFLQRVFARMGRTNALAAK